MKKFLSILLCILMLVPCFAFSVFAEEEEGAEEEITNLALTAGIKATSWWNASTLPKSAINGASTGDIEQPGQWKGHNNYWKPCQPGRDGMGTGPYVRAEAGVESFQLTFRGVNRGYKIIDSVDLYVEKVCSNNPKYTMVALINGVWVDIGSKYQEEGTLLSGYKGAPSKIHFDIPETVMVDGTECKVNTKSVKLEIREFAEAGGCGHGWDTPIIYEIEVYGKTGFIPEIDLHDGAVLTTNAALGGRISASSSASAQYPALAADNVTNTYWNSSATTDGEWICVDFDKAYDLDALEINLGACGANADYTIDAEVKINGVWSVAKTVEASATTGEADNVSIDLGTKNTAVEAIRFTYKSMGGKKASLTEIVATIAGGKKCEFLGEFMNASRKQSVAAGNVAIYGEPYASSVLEHLGISDTIYINDGIIEYTGNAWVASTFVGGAYCGVKLNKSFEVNRVTLYFNDLITENIPLETYVLGFDVQVRDGDDYKTVASATSYNPDGSDTNKYIVSIEFDAVETDDVRILFTENDAGFPYIKELEVYATEKYDDYSTYAHGRSTIKTTKNFGDVTLVPRADFTIAFLPIYKMASITDIRASLWM